MLSVIATQASLGWNEVTGASSYTLQVSADGGNSWQKQEDVPVGHASNQTVNLQSGSNHLFRVVANNEFGTSSPSNSVSVTTPVITPVAPTNLRVTSLSSTSVSLTFDAPVVSGILYRVAESTDGGINWNNIGVTPGTTFTATGLNPGTQVWFEVRAANGTTYSSYTNVVNATPPVPLPPAPSNLVAARDDSTPALDVVLTWQNNDPSLSVNIARSTDGVNFDHLATVNPGVSSFRDTSGLVKGKTYFYEIRAVDVVSGQTYYSAYSNIDAAIPR